MIMNAALQEAAQNPGVVDIEEIHDKKILKFIDKCCTNMIKWGYKIPKDMQWAQAKMDPMGNTLILRDSMIYTTAVAVLLNSGLTELADKDIQDTIYHELIHVVTNKDHEDAAWQAVKRDVVSRTRLVIAEKIDAAKANVPRSYWIRGYKHVFECSKCKQTLGFNNPDSYPVFRNLCDHWEEREPATGGLRFTHSGCGGSWTKIK